MRCRVAALLVFGIACGGRTSLGEGVGASASDEGGTQPGARSSAYKILYTLWPKGIDQWHSTTASIDTLDPAVRASAVPCTYDGRHVGIEPEDVGTFDLVDADGALERTQQGFISAIRPDGMRGMVVRSGCEGTLDADGTYANVRCFDTTEGETFGAEAYAPDGKTVLWSHNVYDPVTTGTHSSLETALEDGTNRREIAPAEDGYFTLASFSFDGSLVTYGKCTPIYGSVHCEVRIVRLDTLETTVVVKGNNIAAPHFLPDGTGIVYFEAQFADSGRFSIQLVDIATRATSTIVEGVSPVYSPPEMCVAFE